MPDLCVLDFPEDLYRQIRDLAARNHRSLEAEVIALIKSALEVHSLGERRATALADIARRRNSLPKSADSLDLLREDRNR